MMHTAACHIRMPAYWHKTNTPAPISSAAEMLTVKARHLLSSLIPLPGRARYPAPELRRILRRSHRTRNRHFSHTPAISPASAPHTHTGRPLRHPVNLRPTLITSCQRSLAFCKVRSAKNATPPDTIGSGKRRVSFRAAPASFQWKRGCPALFSCHSWPYRAPRARPAPYPVQHGPGFFMPHECVAT
jgi:hypothetical protein